jgi:hypothetical protein
MRRVVVTAGVLVLLSALAAAAPAPTKPSAARAPPSPRRPAEPTREELLTKRLRDLETKLRAGTEKDPDLRRRLPDDIERAKQDLGPYDAAGVRVHPQAMWHDGAIDQLEADIKRLAGRAKLVTGAALAMEARIYARQMALVCLTRGWTWGTALKYQFDVYGQYLTNNMALLDGVFDGVAAALTREATLADAAPDRDAFVAALADAKNAIAGMEKAVDQFTNTNVKAEGGREKVVAALGLFTDALQAVYEAEGALGELAEKPKKPETPAASPSSSEPAAAAAGDARNPASPAAPAAGSKAEGSAPPGVSDDDKARLETIRAVVKTLDQAQGWLAVRTALERYAAVAEQGLQMPRARAGALEMLDALAHTAEYVQGLAGSKAAYPEYAAARQKSLEEAFTYLEKQSTRRSGYSLLRRHAVGDRDRRALDAGPLSPEASQGILRASALSYRVFKSETASERFGYDVRAVIDIAGKLAAWPPKDMTGLLTPLYKRFADTFTQAAETAGKMPLDDPDALCQPYAATAVFGRDLERLVRADQAIKAVAAYSPTRARSMYDDLVRQMEGLERSLLAPKSDERVKLDLFFKPFQELADLQLPAPEHQAAAMKLTGNSCRGALLVLANEITRGLAGASAARGTATTLESAMEAKPMFLLLRHRCVAETLGIGKTGTANLDAFSIPEKTWGQFVTALDSHLRQTMTQYITPDPRGRKPAAQSLAAWDQVYCWVAAAQRLAGTARRTGESEMDLLLRHLAQAADPTPPDTAAFGWMVGYHATEAAGSLTDGFEYTAGWHRSLVQETRTERRFEQELTPAILDPAK